ncbi:MAG: hypothetical protein R6V04_03780 [bacterium]
MSFSESLIMCFANLMPHHFDATIRFVFGNRIISSQVKKFIKRKLANIHSLNRILVVADTNIGDAVLLQNAVNMLKSYFPESKIDYLYQKKAVSLIRRNPFINKNLPFFVNKQFITREHKQGISQSIPLQSYDLIINFYPFFSKGVLKEAKCPVLTPLQMIRNIVKSHDNNIYSHILDHLRIYIDEIVERLPIDPVQNREKSSNVINKIFLSEEIPEKAHKFLENLSITDTSSIAILNPDTSSVFTCIPELLQIEILEKMLENDFYDYILLGPGFNFKGIENRLYTHVSSPFKKEKIIILPSDLSIDLFTGLIDRSDLLITGDTAQMHIAAGYKVSEYDRQIFRNKTALVNIFGATKSAIYGYDSFLPNHRDSDQDAYTRVFEGTPGCKNLTCIHKTKKKCRKVKCFHGVDSEEIIDYIKQYLLQVK